MSQYTYGPWSAGPFTVHGIYVSMKNGRKIVAYGGHSALIKKDAALLWEQSIQLQIPRQREAFNGLVELIGDFYYHDKRSDLDENLLKDMIQTKKPGKPYVGLIRDDNQIKRHSTTWHFDPHNPRVVFQLRELKEVIA